MFCTGSGLTVGVEDPGKFFIVKIVFGVPGQRCEKVT